MQIVLVHNVTSKIRIYPLQIFHNSHGSKLKILLYLYQQFNGTDVSNTAFAHFNLSVLEVGMLLKEHLWTEWACRGFQLIHGIEVQQVHKLKEIKDGSPTILQTNFYRYLDLKLNKNFQILKKSHLLANRHRNRVLEFNKFLEQEIFLHIKLH